MVSTILFLFYMSTGHPRLISDLHFGHLNMAIKRGFSSIEEHDKHVISKWNETVRSPKDLTFILGDVTMERSKDYSKLDLLMGRKIVVIGNHDRHQDIRELLNHVENVAGVIDYKGFFLTHIPMHESEILSKHRGNIHGHNHDNRINDKRYINVSCELLDYAPKTIEELLLIQDSIFAETKKYEYGKSNWS